MEFAEFKNMVLKTFRLDLHGYKEKQLKRRLDSYLTRLDLDHYGQLYKLLVTDRQSYHSFLDYITINVSEFFRDPQRFMELQQKYIPELAAGRNQVWVWSAACSNGSEPYSVVIIMDELGLSSRINILATDIDQGILDKARLARYALESLKNVSPQRLQRYFEQHDKGFLLKEMFRSKVSFRYHDLLSAEYPKGYDLILCRNVTIYFTKEAQEVIYRRFNKALNPGGILFIGGSEMIFNYKEIGMEKLATCFYRKM